MKKNIYIILILPALLFFSCNRKNDISSIPEGFVLFPESYSYSEGDSVKIGAFEIMDHPVTNREYAAFVSATAYPCPIHWENGKIPEGFADYPLIYIDREDAYAYTQWLSATDHRVYALPTVQQFTVAARDGVTGKYFWGDDESLITDGLINYDADNTRSYEQWQQYLKPAKWGMQNKAGLYGMCGNVWQITLNNPDPAVRLWVFRIERETNMDKTLLTGGSWARSKEYLKCGYAAYQSSNIKSPDVGIRLIREPEGANWKVIPRKLTAVMTKEGTVALSWAVLKTDYATTAYNIYRMKSANRDTDGAKINEQPVTAASFYIDTDPPVAGERYQYRVVQVDEQGKEKHPSEWTGITVEPGKYAEAVTFRPVYQKPGFVPVFGDLEGSGKAGCVIRLSNGCEEMSQDPGFPVQLEAFTSYGRSLWRKDVARHGNIYGSASNCPFNVWDMDGDGKAEVITLLQMSEENHLAILDGLTGKVKYSTLWPKMVSDNSRSSTRIQLSVGYLDGENPAIITQTGIYENEVITAFDAQLQHLWTYNSFGATNGSGGHKVEIADVDGDGKQEVVYGTTCLNWDGTFRWSIYRKHPDIISIQDYDPALPGLEIFYLVETNMHAGAYLVEANSGKIIWKNNREDNDKWTHGHYGWTADIWDGSLGKECVVNRAGHNDRHYVAFASNGKILQEGFPFGYSPIEWNGDPTRELITRDGYLLGKWNGKEIVEEKDIHPNPRPNSKLIFVADIYGDFRDELVIQTQTEDGREAITVITATESICKKYIAPSEERDYKLWLARNKGGGYASIFDNPYLEPQAKN
ncbi:MAG: SUMF1/EgtB/PvdO family nonheme iron enzyme [Dysgonamonadaceae bacterium]|jgi:rhamnogalacturonan endolyase|nr:SUMF1/EgtB/PvdO family nonheme iron enzyme [Dysgonamonadaceae bacterium]